MHHCAVANLPNTPHSGKRFVGRMLRRSVHTWPCWRQCFVESGGGGTAAAAVAAVGDGAVKVLVVGISVDDDAVAVYQEIHSMSEQS